MVGLLIFQIHTAQVTPMGISCTLLACSDAFKFKTCNCLVGLWGNQPWLSARNDPKSSKIPGLVDVCWCFFRKNSPNSVIKLMPFHPDLPGEARETFSIFICHQLSIFILFIYIYIYLYYMSDPISYSIYQHLSTSFVPEFFVIKPFCGSKRRTVSSQLWRPRLGLVHGHGYNGWPSTEPK